MRLKCWSGGWGLPSIDIDCLSTLTYAYFAKVSFEKVECLPRHTVTGDLPELEENELVYSDPFKIISIYRREGYNKDYGLSAEENADTLAYLALVEQRLRPAILYTLWLDLENYTKVTRPSFAKACGFPWSLWYPSKFRDRVDDYILRFKGTDEFGVLDGLDKIVYKEAHNCLNLLNDRFGTNKFFFGENPTTLDAILYGHLGILLHCPLPSAELKNHLLACDHLKAFCQRIEEFFPDSVCVRVLPEQKQTSIMELVTQNNQVMSIGFAVFAMFGYAIFSGVFTANRSKLAQRIKKYKASNDIPEFDVLD